MIKKEFQARFDTPAFLGDAEQKGAWRTPPFMSLLRQWWRVAAARSFDHDFKRVRMGGIVGSVIYAGDLGKYLSLLDLASKVHIGKQTSFGMGKIGFTTSSGTRGE